MRCTTFEQDKKIHSNKIKKAVVLLSGGQDSTVCLYWALSYFDDVIAVGFDYGQSNSVELQQAQKIASMVGVEYKVFNASNLLAPSSITKHGNHNAPSSINNQLPDSFTAGRNILFLTIAASYGASIGANDIVIGVCGTDYNGYPDCRPNTMDAMQLTLSLGLGIDDVRIHTPLMYLNKAETWRMAKELNCLDVVINYTMTDYDGNTTMNEWGMGNDKNPASRLRAKGYYEAKEKGWI